MRDLDDAEVLEIAIVENIQRAGLNATEVAAGYRQLMERFGHTQEALARALGKSRSHVANLLWCSRFRAPCRIWCGRATCRQDMRALVTAADPQALAQESRDDDRSQLRGRRRTEKDADTRAAERDLAAALGMKVSIDHIIDGEAGSVTLR